MRIAIVNDMLRSVEILRTLVESDPEHSVAWTAHNGDEAVRLCSQDRPDLILMDLLMPVMSGIDATRQIMAKCPCPILIVTVSINSDASLVFEALGAGAVDAIDTPFLGSTSTMEDGGGQGLLAKIRTIGKLTNSPSLTFSSAQGRFKKNIKTESCENLIAIGASSGGPSAIAEILSKIPPDFPAAIVIAQHLDRHFSSGLVEWLGGKSKLPVMLVREGDQISFGKVMMAGTNDHLQLVSAHVLGYTREPVCNPYRPSVDVLFHSVIRHWKGKAAGVLLTGMGSDGANGLKAMREAGHLTIAQNEATSAVYGMPKAAAQMEAASMILPLTLISSTLMQHFSVSSTNHIQKNFNHERVP